MVVVIVSFSFLVRTINLCFIGSSNNCFELIAKLDECMAQYTGVYSKLFSKFLNDERIGIKMHSPISELLNQHAIQPNRNPVQTNLPSVKYSWCLLILWGIFISPQLSKPLTTPPRLITCFAEVFKRSFKLL